MNYVYSKTLNSIIQNNVGRLSNWKPLSISGEYEARLYFATPFWLCGKLKYPEAFHKELIDVGVNSGIIVPNNTIDHRIRFYANNLTNLLLPRIVYYWLYTKPLAELPENEDMFEFTPPEFWTGVLPPLPELIDAVKKMEKF